MLVVILWWRVPEIESFNVTQSGEVDRIELGRGARLPSILPSDLTNHRSRKSDKADDASRYKR